VEASLSSTNVSGIFLDDDNAVTLPDYTRFDARLSFPLGARRLFLDIRNVFDARYSSSGFLDPAGSGERYLYPAARRVIEEGVNGFGW
jgi:outer membrane receptor protein involved in Fe transport